MARILVVDDEIAIRNVFARGARFGDLGEVQCKLPPIILHISRHRLYILHNSPSDFPLKRPKCSGINLAVAMLNVRGRSARPAGTGLPGSVDAS